MRYYVKLNPRACSPFRVASEASGIIFCVPLAHYLSQYLEDEWGLLSCFWLIPVAFIFTNGKIQVTRLGLLS